MGHKESLTYQLDSTQRWLALSTEDEGEAGCSQTRTEGYVAETNEVSAEIDGAGSRILLSTSSG